MLARLRPEFPDVTISKLRFLEAEGLVEPLRAPSGYRKYTAAHLERLRFVLAAQRDRYLPLRVIREQIDVVERGERIVGLPLTPAQPAPQPASRSAPQPAAYPTATAGPPSRPGRAVPVPIVPAQPALTERSPDPAPAVPSPDSAPAWIGLGDARLTRAQLAERSGLDEAGLDDLEQFGLLVPTPNGYYGAEALTVARISARLAEFGFEGRHLRPYRATADREVGLLAQLVPPPGRQSSPPDRPDRRSQALETVHELAALCAQLHGALVRQGLRQVLGP